MSQRPSPATRRAAFVGAVLALVVGLTGCFTGERPTLASGPVMTGDGNVDAVLTRLDKARSGAFTVGYDLSLIHI